MKTYLIKVYHWFNSWKELFKDFLKNIWKTSEDRKMVLGLNYSKWEFYFSLSCDWSTFSAFESQFYTSFNDFQISSDDKWVWNYDISRCVIWEISLENRGYFPFKMKDWDDSEFIFNLFRSFENFDVINDKLWLFVEIKPLKVESVVFYVSSMLKFVWFKIILFFSFFKYMFNYKVEKWWKKKWYDYFSEKLKKELFSAKIYIIAHSSTKESAEGKIRSIFNNFMIFKNYPLNHFIIKFRYNIWDLNLYKDWHALGIKNILSSQEIASFFHFPKNPKNETSLLKVTSRKLALPIWIPTLNYSLDKNWEVIAKNVPNELNPFWVSDYRSIRVPVWLYDEDRLKHIYTIWKTWVWKSKFLINMIINDIKQWRWVWIIDPHGDLIEEAMMHIPENRKDDVIIFDPGDDKFPFCINPLDIKEEESKQILAKWFIDIFKKFFWANWNTKLEHVLRMIFLALLDKKDSTLFDIIRALTDKDFRYEMIEQIEDDVVRNFWTNEFAWWSQQFNTEAIMPILNKVGQLLSIDVLRNIFGSVENKLDFRKMLDDRKILLVKLPKWKLQEEIMGFLWAMFVTKIYQSAMWRQSISKNQRTPFFLYVDEFQNFATETFNEILSEARKYWLGLAVAHQFIKQIPINISSALFGNVWTLVSFRISSEDAQYMKQHFDPFLDGYDLANLDQRCFYCKTLVQWQVKDPFSLKALLVEDPVIDRNMIAMLYDLSRSKYSRPLDVVKKQIEREQKDVIQKIEEFTEPLI